MWKYIDGNMTHVSGFKSGFILVDLYILPENIKQVFSAFANHNPLLLSALAILENFIWGWY